jgi:hypothetical protein
MALVTLPEIETWEYKVKTVARKKYGMNRKYLMRQTPPFDCFYKKNELDFSLMSWIIWYYAGREKRTFSQQLLIKAFGFNNNKRFCCQPIYSHKIKHNATFPILLGF